MIKCCFACPNLLSSHAKNEKAHEKSAHLLQRPGAYHRITLWSVIIIKTRILPASVGYFGVVTCILVIGGMAAGFMFVNLTGFRVFIAGIVVWMAVIGMTLNKHTPTAAEV